MKFQGNASGYLQNSHLIESDENIQIISRYMKWEDLKEKTENAMSLLSLISQQNSNHPYHNSRHSYMVAEYAKQVFQEYIKTHPHTPSYIYLSLFQIFVAERGHDVAHPGKNVTQQDEEESAKIMKNILKGNISDSEKLKEHICESVGYLIINGTKFEWRNPVLKEKISQNVLLKIMQDADILYLGDTYDVFIEGSIRYAVEQMEWWDFSEEILNNSLSFTVGGFREMILQRNEANNSPFYMEESQILYPNFHKNMKTLKGQLESEDLKKQAKTIYDIYYKNSL